MQFLFLTRSLLYSLFFFFINFSITPSYSIRKTPQATDIAFENWSINYTVSELKNHFHRFGYLDPPQGNTSTNFTDEVDSRFESAILRYQSNLGLSVTGKIDTETLSQISTPRCGLADTTSTSHTNLTLHGITTKRRYVYFPGKPRWSRKMPMKLTYAFSPEHPAKRLSPSDVRRAFRRAFSRWSSVIPVSFREDGDYGYSDMRIGFYDGDHGDSEPFDGALGVLAHSFSPESGRLHLDAAEDWAVDGFRGEGSAAIDLESVATHEIGHLLGLGHSSEREAVMYPSLKPRERKLVLQIDDIEGVQALYGSNPNFSATSLLESDLSSSMSNNLGVVGFRNSERSMIIFAILLNLIDVCSFFFL